METLPNDELIQNQEIQDFLERRGIKPEDHHLISSAARFPKSLVIECLHNLFNLRKEMSGRDLEHYIKNENNEEKRNLFSSFLDVYRAYDWAVCMDLVRVLEKL